MAHLEQLAAFALSFAPRAIDGLCLELLAALKLAVWFIC
jgi:hypothetical protein